MSRVLYAPRRPTSSHGNSESLLRDVKRHSPAPIWLVGTSRGTVPATAATVNDAAGLIAGLDLTSSVVAFRTPGAVPTQELARIKVPTLLVHHENDQCKVCAPDATTWIMSGLKSAPVKARLMLTLFPRPGVRREFSHGLGRKQTSWTADQNSTVRPGPVDSTGRIWPLHAQENHLALSPGRPGCTD
jgi:hypothetical protein